MRDYVEQQLHLLSEKSRTKLQELGQSAYARRARTLILRFGFVVPFGLGVGG